MSVFSSDMQAQSSVQLTQEMKRETALSTLSAEEVLGRRLGYVTSLPGDSAKMGVSEHPHVLPAIPDFPQGCGKRQGAGLGRLQGARGQRGDPDGQEAA